MPCPSLSVGTVTGGSIEYTHVTSDVSKSLSAFLTAEATGHTDVFLSVSMRTARGSVCSAAPIDE